MRLDLLPEHLDICDGHRVERVMGGWHKLPTLTPMREMMAEGRQGDGRPYPGLHVPELKLALRAQSHCHVSQSGYLRETGP